MCFNATIMRWIVLSTVICFATSEKLLTVNPGVNVDVSRIVGGSATTIDTYPYVVQVLNSNQFFCAGSLLTARHVLSAGHCFVDQLGLLTSPSVLSIRAGTTYLNTGGTRHGVSAVVVHERYNNPIRDNDVAVLVLSSRVSISNSKLASIPVQGAVVKDNEPVIHVGWGATESGGMSSSAVLLHVEVLTVGREECAARYDQLRDQFLGPFRITDSMICAGLLNVGGADACQGDSGGPLIYNGVVVGITSWGWECGHPIYPGVSARVSSYTNWINNTVTGFSGASENYVSILLIFICFIMSSNLLRHVDGF